MNNHNDSKTIKEGRLEKLPTKSYYQELIVKKAFGQRLTGLEKRNLLRLKGFNLVGRAYAATKD
jgi:hypothetical protein